MGLVLGVENREGALDVVSALEMPMAYESLIQFRQQWQKAASFFSVVALLSLSFLNPDLTSNCPSDTFSLKLVRYVHGAGGRGIATDF